MPTSEKSTATPRSQALLLLAVTAVMWSLGGLLIKSIDLNPLAVTGVRSAIAALVILAFVPRPKFTWSKRQVGAAVAYAATAIFFVAANRFTTATNAIMLMFTAPIYVALLSQRFLKEKTTSTDLVVICTTLGGMTLFFLDYLGPSGVFGNVLAMLGGIAFAGFTILMRLQKDGSPLESVLLGNVITALIGIPFLVGRMPSAPDWPPLLLLGVVQLGLPYVLYSRAIKHVSALDAILVPVLEPLLSPMWVFLMLGETPGSWAAVGAMVILVSATFRYLGPLLKGSTIFERTSSPLSSVSSAKLRR